MGRAVRGRRRAGKLRRRHRPGRHLPRRAPCPGRLRPRIHRRQRRRLPAREPRQVGMGRGHRGRRAAMAPARRTGRLDRRHRCLPRIEHRVQAGPAARRGGRAAAGRLQADGARAAPGTQAARQRRSEGPCHLTAQAQRRAADRRPPHRQRVRRRGTMIRARAPRRPCLSARTAHTAHTEHSRRSQHRHGGSEPRTDRAHPAREPRTPGGRRPRRARFADELCAVPSALCAHSAAVPIQLDQQFRGPRARCARCARFPDDTWPPAERSE